MVGRYSPSTGLDGRMRRGNECRDGRNLGTCAGRNSTRNPTVSRGVKPCLDPKYYRQDMGLARRRVKTFAVAEMKHPPVAISNILPDWQAQRNRCPVATR